MNRKRKINIHWLLKKISIKKRRATFVALLFFLFFFSIINADENKALWVVRDHMLTPVLIDQVIEFAEKNSYQHLFVQVRGRGDSYYSSKIVPKSHLLKNNDFDPLMYILKRSKKNKKIKIHAWLNVYYLWSAAQKPFQNDHLLINHPDWLDNKTPDFMDVTEMLNKMKRNRKVNGEGFYLAPTHPEVDAHLQNVVTEILQNYSLDGIHFDYIRYHADGWGMNPTGLKFFLDYSSGGIPGIPSIQVQEKPNFAEFKRKAITNFLKKSSMRIRAYQPQCVISAAVKPNLEEARNVFCQEWDVWIEKGYLDWAVPMNYTSNNNLFTDNINTIKMGIDIKNLEKILMGIGIYNQKPQSSIEKIRLSQKEPFGGVSIFSYTVFTQNPSYSQQLQKFFKNSRKQ